jgi:predicted PurR-regulated permease PerM
LVFTAFFLALALNAPVHWLGRHLPGKMRGKRSFATAFSFLLVILFLGLFIASIVPPLIKQTETFINAIPTLSDQARSGHGTIGEFVQRYHLQNQLDSITAQLNQRLQHVSGTAITGITKVGSSIFSLLTVLVLTFMMLIEGPEIVDFFRELVHKDKRDHVDELSRDMYRVVKGYVNGQVILAALAAVLIVPAVFILGISYPIALMVVIFVCGLIPMVGHTIGAIIVTLVALATSPVAAIIILAYYILYQQIENYLIQPRIQANTTNMSPLLIFISVIVGVSFGGLIGGLFAIPVAGCIRIAVLDYLKNHEYLGNKPVVEEEIERSESKAAPKAA